MAAKTPRAKTKMGRPPKAAGERKRPAIGLRLTDAERARLRKNAAAGGQTVAGYIVARCCS
jgi:uncharacterized protein (DUF1778 family)